MTTTGDVNQADSQESQATISTLAADAWGLFESLGEANWVVKPAVPILFFGDLDAYLKSPIRVITVGLNPSLAEFPTGTPFKRFKAAHDLNSLSSAQDGHASYLGALSAYFEDEPYRKWFGSLEPILNGMEASFYHGRPNRALHTDLCSPIATNPTWSKLQPEARGQLGHEGTQLWHRLVQTLEPDLIIISVARGLLDQIRFQKLGDQQPIFSVDRQNPYVVQGRKLKIHSRGETMLAFGRAATTPFGLISNDAKRKLGQRLLEGFASGPA